MAVVGTVYIMFVCLFVVGHKCIQGTWKWKHMIYGHFLSEFERLNNDSFVNFKRQNCNSSFVNLRFKTIFVWEAGFVNLRCKTSDLEAWGEFGQGGCTNNDWGSRHLSKDITDKNRFICRLRRSLLGTNFECLNMISWCNNLTGKLDTTRIAK